MKRKEFILKVVCCLYGLELSKLQIYLLTELCSIYYNEQIGLSTETRRKIKSSLDTSYATFTNTLKVLEDKGIIKKEGKLNNSTYYSVSNYELELALIDNNFTIKV